MHAEAGGFDVRAHAPVAKSPKARIKELEAEVTLLRGQERREVCELRRAVQIMAQQVQVLALAAGARMRHSAEAVDETDKAARRNVVPLHPVSWSQLRAFQWQSGSMPRASK